MTRKVDPAGEMTGEQYRSEARTIEAALRIIQERVSKPRLSELDLLVAKLTAIADRLYASATRADDRKAPK